MNDEERSEVYRRYEAAAHAMQSGVAMEMNHTNAHDPKHLRVGVNSAMVEHSALAKLLIKKGIIHEDDYLLALAEGMEDEQRAFEERLSEKTGVKVSLG